MVTAVCFICPSVEQWKNEKVCLRNVAMDEWLYIRS